MPRRNRRECRPRYTPAEQQRPAPTYEAMARALVLAGVRSPLILEHPHRLNDRNPA